MGETPVPLGLLLKQLLAFRKRGKSFLRQRLEIRPTGIPDKAKGTRNVQCIRTPTWDSLKTRLLQLISLLFVSIALFFLWLLFLLSVPYFLNMS